MKARDVLDLLLLAAVWGASFIFMRRAAPEFGPVPLVAVRVTIAAAFLMAIVLLHGRTAELRAQPGALLVVGILNSALPFALIGFAVLHISGGHAALLNASTPLWGALVAWLWFGDKLNTSRVFGLLLGLVGVAVLSGGRGGGAADTSLPAVVAMLLATLSYGVSASYTRRYLSQLPALTIATGSMLGASASLLIPAWLLWPTGEISFMAWASAAIMGVVSTGIAYIIYFRLVASIGPARAIAVTFLVPAFGMLWGALFMDETVTLRMLAGGGVILLGTALSTGLLMLPLRRRNPPGSSADG